MIISDSRSYNYNIEVKPKYLLEIERLLLCYFDIVTYKVMTYNKKTLDFTNLHNLLKYDNYSKDRIKNLYIFGDCYGSIQSVVITIDQNNTIFSYILNENITSYILSTFETIVRKMKSHTNYRFLCYLILPYLAHRFTHNLNTTINIVIVAGLISLGISFLLSTFLFPPCVFLWGEESDRIKRLDSTRKNIFWGVIVTILIEACYTYASWFN